MKLGEKGIYIPAYNLTGVISLFFCMILIIVLFTIMEDSKSRGHSLFSFPSVILMFIILCLILIICYVEFSVREEIENRNQWIEEVAHPYIKENIDINASNLLSVSLTEDTSEKVGSEFLRIVYKDYEGNIINITDEFVFYMDLKSGEKPYFTYRDLDIDLNKYVPKGPYFGEVHVPVDYDLR